MQTSIAKFSKSIFVKILVGIIILPFVFWGMGDIFRGGNQNILVTIDSEKVSTQEFINYVNRLNLNETERKEISNTNLLERIVSEYTGRKIIDLEEKNMGIIINNNSLKNIITNDKTFFKDGKFSRTEYEKFLIKSSITAPAFEQNIIEQEKRRQLLSFLSSGVIVPKHMVEKEFNKENQIKTIKYIDLANFYKNRPPKKDEIKKIYDENKQIFFENFKIINFLKLTPELLIGKSDYDKVFFSKIEKIENSILDGMTITMIATNNDLKFSTTEEINKKKLNKNGVKYNKISDDLFDKAFVLNEINSPQLINIKDEYYLFEIKSINKVERGLDNKDVLGSITKQVKLKNKIENNTNIVKKISSGQYNLLEMKKFAKENNLEIKDIKLTELKDNNFFNKSIIKEIFLMRDNEFNLITDSMLSNNFIVFIDKTIYNKMDKTSENYKKYKSKARLNFSKEIYNIYDKSINIKYDITLNQKAIDRIKNSF